MTANLITRANAGGPRMSPIWTAWGARVAQFYRLDDMRIASLALVMTCLLCGCAGPERTSNTASHLTAPPPGRSKQSPGPASRGEAPPFIYVEGEFKSQGRYAWTNGMTLKDAFAIAGGFTEFAWSRIWLEHWDGSSETYKWTAKQPLRSNPVLTPGDRVINPRR